MHHGNTVDRRAWSLPYPERDNDGEIQPHLHVGSDGIDDPLCYPCHDVGYEAGIGDACYALGVTPELIRGIIESAASPFDRYRGPTRYFLYWLHGANDRLLYVGITRNLRGRMRAHGRAWGDVIERIEYEEYPDHRSVLAAEAAEIAEKCPPFNAAGVGA